MTAHRSSIPTATYRLQFNKHFTFQQASEIVPYLRDLGISHVYASPIFKAPPESLHGYDICDHNELNPAIGNREDFDAFVATLHEHGLGQIADFVPNHMGIVTPLNAWWMDVLENGPGSRFASHFDIDWQPVKDELNGKVLLPILGDQYGRVLERGELKLEFSSGAFFVRYFDAKLPVEPRTGLMVLRPAFELMTTRELPDAVRLEVQSIMTALDHLPPPSETDGERVTERAREKEVIKQRLTRVCYECAGVREAVEETMRSIEGRVGEPQTFDVFDALLSAQVYRLSYWRVAAEEINHRRFFDVNELAAIRVELPEVFAATHRLLFELIGNGSLDGIRIDHVDGLCLPRAYLQQLRARWAEVLGDEEKASRAFLVVEKILIGEERLRADWPVSGTTGYEFANEVLGLFIDPASEKRMTHLYAAFTGCTQRYEDIIYHTKLLMMHLALSSEINMLGHMLSRLAEKNRWYRDFTLNALIDGVREITACFPVYRTYLAPGEEPGPADREAVLRAVRMAKRRNPSIERSLFNFLGEILLGKFPPNIDDAGREEHLRFVLKFQQCSGPIMAKGVEDTAFYRYNRLVALNEVGGEPSRFGLAPRDFFERCARRRESHSHMLLATTTHDTKRSEDVRSRIAVLSEMPREWQKAIQRWRTLNRRHKKNLDGETVPDGNEELLLYQTLVGTWPVTPMSEEQHAGYVSRIQAYMTKALREAKSNSSWIQPNEEWEAGVRDFIAAALQPGKNKFTADLAAFNELPARHGAMNSLAQLVLKCTTPGTPDFYQGTELWDDSLVDPDNRRPVDYDARRHDLKNLREAPVSELFQNWPDGRLKLHITRALLHHRRENPALYQHGDFTPLEATGRFADNCIAFSRRFEDQTLLVIVPRLTTRLPFPAIGEIWADTLIKSAADCPLEGVRNILTGEAVPLTGSEFRVAGLLTALPVGVFAAT